MSYDLPTECETYLHRVGRTARAGRGGTAISLVTQHDIEQLKAIEAFTGSVDLFRYNRTDGGTLAGVKLTEHANDEDDVLKNLHDATVAEKIAQQVPKLITDGACGNCAGRR